MKKETGKTLQNERALLNEQMLLLAGDLFSKIHTIANKNDSTITFEVNAENCYYHAKVWKEARLVVTIILILALILLAMQVKPYTLGGITVAIGYIYFKLFSMINRKSKFITQMAKEWKPNRKILLRLVKKFCNIDDVEIFNNADTRDALPALYRLFRIIAERIAGDIVKIESLTDTNQHPRLDKDKRGLSLMAKEFDCYLMWDDAFDEAKKNYGRRDKI